MALENLFIRTKRSIQRLKLDAVISENFTNTYRPTKNPIEFGAEVSDHVIIDPKLYSMSAVVSDTPLGTVSIGLIVDDKTGFFGDSTGEGKTRSQVAFEFLLFLADTKEPLEIQTGLKSYKDLVITSITASRDKNTSGALFFNISFQEAIIIQTEIIDIPEVVIAESDIAKQAGSPTKQGRKLTQPVNEDDNRTTFLQFGEYLVKNVGDLFGD
ncbi:hypothetical protein IID23_02275 [Patescibacteria group bacterium]|nr:hypothetical protein [Patescibacteria group bacterium]